VFCPSCGKTVDDKASFCPFCGAALRPGSSASTSGQLMLLTANYASGYRSTRSWAWSTG